MSSVRRIISLVFQPNAYGWVLFLFLILFIPSFYAVFQLSDLQGRMGMKLAYLAFSMMIWLFPALFLRMRVYFLLASVFMLLAPVEMAHIAFNKMPVTEGFISAIVNTNAGEAFEFLKSVKVFCVIVTGIWILYYVVVFTKIENNYLFTHKVNLGLGTMFIGGNLLLFIVMMSMAWQMKAPNPWEFGTEHFAKKYRKIYPVDLLTVSRRAFVVHQDMCNLHQQLSGFSFGAEKTASPHKEIYVVVIGESARYGNFSVNGYSRDTSPLLGQTAGLLSFSNVYSTANLTEIELPLLLTRATPLNPETGYKEKTFVDAFAEGGFHTAWIAAQSSQYKFIKRIAEDADYSFFSTTDFDASMNYDEHLLPHLDRVLAQKNEKQFIVIHTLGSHFRYNFRYPELFAVYKPALEGTVGLSVLSPANKEVLVNSYDNTIRYVDFILSAIIEKVKREEAVSAVLYISDHAENLYDDDNNLILHGGGQFSKWETHIPLFVWTSEMYKQLFPFKQMEMENNRDKMLSSDNFFHTILDIADIHYPEQQTEKSFASSRFEQDSVRYVLMPDNNVISLKQ